MDLYAYEQITKSESASRKYVLGFCFKNQQRFCPRCGSRKLYRLTGGKYRCSRCKYTFQERSGRWINNGNLSYGQWIRIIKLFELEISTRKMSHADRLYFDATLRGDGKRIILSPRPVGRLGDVEKSQTNKKGLGRETGAEIRKINSNAPTRKK